MPLTSISQSSFGTPIQIASDAPGSGFVVEKNVMLWSTDNDAIQLTGGDHDLVVHGAVMGSGDAVLIAGPALSQSTHSLHVSETGSLMGKNGGALIYGPAIVVNDGEIRGLLGGIGVFAEAGAKSVITNNGLIAGGQGGIAAVTHASSRVEVTNTGHVEGGLIAYLGGEGSDLVTNKGVISGAVSLGKGNDVFDNRGGTVEGKLVDGLSSGIVNGGEGDDRFVAGAGAETVDGSTGFDTLDFRSGGAVKVSLLDQDGSDNTGAAKGDHYTGIERIWGSSSGADTLTGNGSGNVLSGLGGVDRMRGEGGADHLNGGAGADKITGGAGNDIFHVASLKEAGDQITDFSNLSGNNDAFKFNGQGLGLASFLPGQLSGQNFRAAVSSNAAKDGDDIFIFRDSDDTLWFDRDGSGSAHSSQLVADLQAGAVVTASDIFLA